MKIERIHIPDVLVMTPEIHTDERGSLEETYRMDCLEKHGHWRPFVQQNESRSEYGVLRGLHYQLLQPQAKLVRVSTGRIRDVVVDVRPESPAYGRYAVIELNDENRRSLLVPRGCAHGFLVLSHLAVVSYLCDDFYSGLDDQHGIRWDDPTLDIPWHIPDPIVSAKDRSLPRFRDIPETELPTPGQ